MNNMLLKNKPRNQYRLSDGTLVPGVSTVLDVLAKPALAKWFWEGGFECGKPYELDPCAPPLVPPPVKPQTFAEWQNASKDGTAGVGTIAHYKIHAYLNGYEPTYDPKLEKAHIEMADVPFKNFYNYYNSRGGQLIYSEYSLVHPRLRYGGTPDLVVQTKEGYELWDVKTSKAVYEEYWLQLAAYKMLLDQDPKMRQMRLRPRIILVPLDGRLLTPTVSQAYMRKARNVWEYLIKMYHRLNEFRKAA